MPLQHPHPPPLPPLEHRALPPAFRCVPGPGGVGAIWITVAGELDLVGAPELTGALREAIGSARLVVLDLGGLEFIDSSGIHTIVDASSAAAERGTRLVVTGARSCVRSAFDASGAGAGLTVLDLVAGGAS